MSKLSRSVTSITVVVGCLLVAGALVQLRAGEGYSVVAPSVTLFDDDTAFLGVNAEEETDTDEGGARLTSVSKDSPADEAGLEKGDVVVLFDGHVVRGPVALTQRIHDREPGDSVEVEYLRDGERRKTTVELSNRASQWRGLTVVPDGDDILRWSQPLERFEGPGGFTYSFGWGRPKLGVQLVETTPELREHLGGDEDSGVLISKVLRNTPAEDAGLQVGDLLLTVDGETVSSSSELREVLAEVEGGQTVRIELMRDGKPVTVDAEFPEPETDRPTGPRAWVVPAPDAPEPPFAIAVVPDGDGASILVAPPAPPAPPAPLLVVPTPPLPPAPPAPPVPVVAPLPRSARVV